MRDDEMLESISQGQGLSIAFARRTSPAYINERGVIEQVACLANGEGGTLFVGVNQDGTVSGCYPFHGEDTNPAQLEATIRRYTSPPLTTTVSVASLPDGDIVAITVAPSLSPVATTWGVYRSRRLNAAGTPECAGMDPAYLFTRYRDANAIDWARVPVPGLPWEDLDPDAFNAVREIMDEAQGDAMLASLDDDALLRSLGFHNDSVEPLAFGALLLFGTREALARHLPYHQLVVVDIAGSKRTSRSSAPLAIIVRDLQKQREKLDPPVRELIINGLVHRDYSLPGAVYVYTDAKRTTVTSPGGLPRGLNSQAASSATATYAPRSLALSTALARFGVVDGAGLGVAHANEELTRAGRGPLSWAGTHEQAVTVTASREVVHPQIPALVRASGTTLDLDELLVMDVWHGNVGSSISDIAGMSGLEPRWVERAQQRLRAAGLAPTTRRETIEQTPESQVIVLIQEQGEVASGDVASELGISQQQAYRLLKKLVDAGRLRKVGHTRTTRYVLPEA